MTVLRQQLDEKLIALHQASLQLVEDVSIDSLLERIAILACEQANARYSALGVTGSDDKTLDQFITVGLSGSEVKRIAHNPMGNGLLGEIIRSRDPLRVPNIAADHRSAGFPEHHPHMRSFLGVPILLGEKPVGHIYLTDKTDGTDFNTEDEQIIQMLASYAAVAIKNATYVEELNKRDQMLQRHTQDLELLNNIGGSINTSVKPDEILQNTLSLVISHLNVEAGEIFLVSEDKNILELALHRGQAAEVFWTRNKFNIGEGVIGQVAKTGKPVISYDLENDDRFLRSAIVLAGFRQMACFPLISRGVVIGVLAAFTLSQTMIDERDLKIISAICNWAGIAIENTNFHHDARRMAVLEERDRIGMDLHDGIIQDIYGVGLMLDHARLDIHSDPNRSAGQIQTAINGLNRTIRDIRSYILDLKPRELGEENLLDGLKRLVMEYKVNTLADAVLKGQAKELANLPQKHALALFLICQEALANIAKHAHAKRVELNVWTSPERVMMEIQDNGLGFDVEKSSQTLGHGLSNMHTRAKNVGGDLEITSVLHEGTSIFAWVPRGKA